MKFASCILLAGLASAIKLKNAKEDAVVDFLLKEAFDFVAGDDDHIDASEFEGAVHWINDTFNVDIKEDDALDVFYATAGDDDLINEKEFLDAIETHLGGVTFDEAVQVIFDAIDVNDNNSLSKQEMANAIIYFYETVLEEDWQDLDWDALEA